MKIENKIKDCNKNKDYINPNSVLNLYRAFDFSKYIGYTLNTFININYKSNDQFLNMYLFRVLRSNINRWIMRANKRKKISETKPVWLYVFENPFDNFHVHWLIHLYKDIRDKCIVYLEKQLVKLQNAVLTENQIDIRSVNPYTDKVLANYLCKGIRPDYIDFFYLHSYAAYQGHIIKQRTRVSQSLGRTARKKAGFDASKMRHLWEKRHPQIAHGYVKPKEWDLNEIVPQLTGSKKFPSHQHYWYSCSYPNIQSPAYHLASLSERIMGISARVVAQSKNVM